MYLSELFCVQMHKTNLHWFKPPKRVSCQMELKILGWTCKSLKKTKSRVTIDLAIPLLRIYPEKAKTLIQKDTCTPMFTAALFTIAKTWKQPKCPSTDEWIKKMWYQSKDGRRPKQTFLQRRHTDGQEAHEKLLNITNY